MCANNSPQTTSAFPIHCLKNKRKRIQKNTLFMTKYSNVGGRRSRVLIFVRKHWFDLICITSNKIRKWSKTKRRYSVFCFLWFYLLVVRGASGKCPQNSLFRKMQREFKDSCSVETFCKNSRGATESWTQKSPTPNKLLSQFLGCTRQLFFRGFTK